MFHLLDIIGTMAFAISGVLTALNKKLDPFGVFIIAFVTAVGGGTLRDVLIGRTPVGWMRDMQYVSLVECKLETGRTHQIRVHMQHIQHPVFNDNEYGGDKIIKGLPTANYKRFIENCFELIPGQALHARTLELTHPATGERMRFEKELPEGFQAIIERFEKAQLSV